MTGFSIASVTSTRGAAMPPGLIPLAIFCLVVLGPGPNIDLAELAIGVLIAGSLLLWRQGETPALLFAFCLSWLGSAVTSFYGNWLTMDVAEFAPFGGEVHQAVELSLFGVLSMAVGMRLGRGRAGTDAVAATVAAARSLPMATWFRVWLLGLGIAGFAAAAGMVLPDALGQLLLGFANLKWAFYFLLAYASFIQGSTSFLGIAFAVELAFGIGGFFSDFKTVFLVTLVAFVTSGKRLSPRSALFISLFTAILLMLGTVWSSVKGEYRDYIGGGNSGQQVVVDYSDRMGKLVALIEELDKEKLANGFDAMLRRLSYVEYFAVVLNYVPMMEPHSNGDILLDAVIRPFTPRILFPNKAVIDDTARTNQYTGGLGGKESGTSISLGYVAECFIDFGSPGMFGGLMVIGLVYGLTNRWLLGSFSPILGNALATAIIISVAGLENSFTKIFGGLVAMLIAAWVLRDYVIPRWIPQLRRTTK